MKKLIAQLMKFGVVGVIAFIIDYGLLALLTEAFGVNYLVSATISFTVSVVFNYVASMRYVFTHKEGMSRRREFIIFVVLSVIGLGINNACMWAGVVTLNYDVENNEPARLDVLRVRAKCKWCPRQGSNLWPSAPEADALSN